MSEFRPQSLDFHSLSIEKRQRAQHWMCSTIVEEARSLTRLDETSIQADRNEQISRSCSFVVVGLRLMEYQQR